MPSVRQRVCRSNTPTTAVHGGRTTAHSDGSFSRLRHSATGGPAPLHGDLDRSSKRAFADAVSFGDSSTSPAAAARTSGRGVLPSYHSRHSRDSSVAPFRSSHPTWHHDRRCVGHPDRHRHPGEPEIKKALPPTVSPASPHTGRRRPPLHDHPLRDASRTSPTSSSSSASSSAPFD